MPKAPRDKESAAPKKRARKTTPENGNGMHADNGNGAVTAASVATAAAPTVSTQVTEPEIASNLEEQIRQRAYEIYLERGQNGGSPEQDWMRAVQEICGQQRTA